MSDSSGAVLKEAADLHRFLQPLARMCSVARTDHPYYSDASYNFFVHINGLIKKTLLYLEDLPNRPSKHPVIQRSTRQRLKLLRFSWGLLHRYIKPCLDADALHTPLPLLEVLNDRVRQIPECSEFDYAVFQLSEVTYAMVTYNEVNSVANKIARIVKGEDFPRALSLVGIPYSQSSGLFLNCSLAHEMAHFVHQEVMGKAIAAQIDEILERHYPSAKEDPDANNESGMSESSEKFLETLSEIRGLLNYWVEEIFCDLFAISIVGPAFTFAFAELNSASLIAEESNDSSNTSFEFGPSHPADVARFYLHMSYLQRLGWWDFIEKWDSSSVEFLTSCAGVYKKATLSNKISEETRSAVNLDCFWDACDWLLEHLKTKLPDPKTDIRSMIDQYDVISEYLSRAIVPSTIVTDSGTVHPSPIVLINSAFRFVLEESQKLLDNIEGMTSDPVNKRSWYTERLELWVLKALEDQRFLSLSQEGR